MKVTGKDVTNAGRPRRAPVRPMLRLPAPKSRSVYLHESDPQRRRTMARRSKLCSTIMIVVTIVALTWLFFSAIAGAPGNWGYLFWLPWVIGGLSCGIVNVVVDEWK